MSDRPDFDRMNCPLPLTAHDTVQLAHGAGGRLSDELIDRLIRPRFANAALDRQEDQAVLEVPAGRLSFSTDTFVVSPLEFPGGDIGDLAVNGTVNDVAMAGADPFALSVGLVLEEGLEIAALERILDSMARAAHEAGVELVTGDTKVVDRGACDRMFINTSGVGLVRAGVELGAARIRPGDALLLSGTVADHGMAVMTAREGLSFQRGVRSDTCALNGLVGALLDAVPDLRALRDPTRGGVATTLNEFARAAGVGIRLREDAVPLRADVRAACELLGIDPLYVANEGKLIAAVPAEHADAALAAARAHPHGRDAVILGEAVADHPGTVSVITALGAERILPMPVGEQLPRIC